MRVLVLCTLFVHTMIMRFCSAFRPLVQRPSSSLLLRSVSERTVSRPPFQMPKNSSNDSSKADTSSAWNSLGLWTELTETLTKDMKLASPTAVQQLVLPQLLLDQPNNHVAFLAATGSGKTLGYALPIMQLVKQQEVFPSSKNPVRSKNRPRALILAPTRELALQIKDVLKQLSHGIKLSVQIITGGESLSKQRKYLEKSPVDILVATPGRLMQHVQDRTVILNNSHLKYVVLDEMDTMVEQGFASDIAKLLYPVLYHKQSNEGNAVISPETDLVENCPSVWLTSATMTQSVQKMIGHIDSSIQARKHFVKDRSAASKLVLPQMKVLRAKGLHKVVPTLSQIFVDVGSQDKMSLLLNYLDNKRQTMIFCNTGSACRAVEYALAEAGRDCLSYHGDLNSSARSSNLATFRDQPTGILICTDLAARGLDVPTVDHVIMFDFPLNALDYLHRSGRTARGVRKGTVTALVTKRDTVLATAIERAVREGDPLDGLSSRRSDYQIGGRLHKASRGPKRNTYTKGAASRGKPVVPRGSAARKTSPRRQTAGARR